MQQTPATPADKPDTAPNAIAGRAPSVSAPVEDAVEVTEDTTDAATTPNDDGEDERGGENGQNGAAGDGGEGEGNDTVEEIAPALDEGSSAGLAHSISSAACDPAAFRTVEMVAITSSLLLGLLSTAVTIYAFLRCRSAKPKPPRVMCAFKLPLFFRRASARVAEVSGISDPARVDAKADYVPSAVEVSGETSTRSVSMLSSSKSLSPDFKHEISADGRVDSIGVHVNWRPPPPSPIASPRPTRISGSI